MLTGHSLGASAAKLLSIKIFERLRITQSFEIAENLVIDEKYEQRLDVECVAFAPSAAAILKPLKKKIGNTQFKMWTVALGDDIVPRLTEESVTKLMQAVKQVLLISFIELRFKIFN